MIKWFLNRGLRLYGDIAAIVLYMILSYGFFKDGLPEDTTDIVVYKIGLILLLGSFFLWVYHLYLSYKSRS
jgi:hypothetical protein